MEYIDTHCHLDGEEFNEDRLQVIQRAKDAGCVKIGVPAIDLKTSKAALALAQEYKDLIIPMLGLHPEEVKTDWQNQLDGIYELCKSTPKLIIGEVGLDYYWSREFEKEQLEALECQVKWAVEFKAPLMIHCRKGQNEMVKMLRCYEKELVGGVFHCFTGNAHEAEELLAFDKFCLGIGGVLTFKKSNLPETLAQAVPLTRIVLETDAPYMAPVPHRGKRNESSFVVNIIDKLAEIYDTTPENVARITTENAYRFLDIQL